MNEESELIPDDEHLTIMSIFKQIFNCKQRDNPTKLSENIVTIEIFLYCIVCVLIGLCALYLNEPIQKGDIWAIVLTSLIVVFGVILIISLVTQPTSMENLSFKVC